MPDLPPEDATLPPAGPDTTSFGTEAGATLPPAAACLLRPGLPLLPITLGRYRLEQQLGQGGMGAVYRAHDTQLGRTVALKIPFLRGSVDDAVRARFLREAQAAAVLTHPNICPVHDLGEIDGVPYMTMGFIQGKPLAKFVDATRPMEPRRAVELVRKVAFALEEAHRRGIIHRDLKPGNVMIDERGEPVVMDFGLARRADEILALTQEGDLMGTPAYMPPEQMTGNLQLMGPGCDIYSLGVMLYELVAGRPPFLGDLFSLASQITCDPPAPPSRFRAGLDPRLDAICLVATAKLPGDRYLSMRAFAEALAPLEAPSPIIKTPSQSQLTLRLTGTSLAYRPPPGRAVISLGRQKRRPGEPPEVGNDMVLRVPGNDELSARVSRRHLEIHRGDDGLMVIDRSKGGTLHNGRPLTRDVATPLAAGDRLVVAGVLTLDVVLEADAQGRRLASGEINVPREGGAMRVALEVSVGDMMTME